MTVIALERMDDFLLHLSKNVSGVNYTNIGNHLLYFWKDKLRVNKDIKHIWEEYIKQKQKQLEWNMECNNNKMAKEILRNIYVQKQEMEKRMDQFFARNKK